MQVFDLASHVVTVVILSHGNHIPRAFFFQVKK